MVDNPSTPRMDGDTDAPHVSPVKPVEDIRSVMINNVSWGAVLAGVFLALVTQLMLNMLGAGIGAATLSPLSGDNPGAATLSIGAGLWWAVSGIIAAFVGGHTAGRLSGRPKESTAAWHGLTAWALATLFVVLAISTSVGSLAGGALSAVGRAGQTVTQAAAPMAARAVDPFQSIELDMRAGSTADDPAALRDAASASVRAVLTGDSQRAQEARDRAAPLMARSLNISPDEARARLAGYEQQYRQAIETARQRALEAADAAARTVSRAALLAFVALLLGAVAAWFGGRLGTVAPTITRDYDADYGRGPLHPAR